MEVFDPKKVRFDFVRWFKPAFFTSVVLALAGVVLFFVPGLNYGIDFRGGIEATVEFHGQQKPSQGELRSALEDKLKDVSVVNFNEADKTLYSVTAQGDDQAAVSTALNKALENKFGPGGASSWTVEKLDFVGPRVGRELRQSALLGLIYTCILITLYLYWRFDLRFTPGAMACIVHDLLLTTGFLVLTRAEFSTTVVAALLTLAGYSINDTVVVFDRIRELEPKLLGKDRRFIVNEAINSTLSRTVLTAGTTLVSCVVLYVVGGPTLRDFAGALFFGIVVGTYSSAFVAAPLFLWTDEYFSKKEKAQSALAAAK